MCLDHNITGRCHYLQHSVSMMMLPSKTTERRNSGHNHFLPLVNLDKQVESKQYLVMGFCVMFTTLLAGTVPWGLTLQIRLVEPGTLICSSVAPGMK